MKIKTLFITTVILGASLLVLSSCQEKSETEQQTAEHIDLVQAMDEYHRVLRPLMHQALPEKDVNAFKENADELLRKAETLSEAEIPKKFAGQESRIDSLRSGILTKTQTFAETAKTGSGDEIFDAFLAAHDEYEVLADLVYKL